MTYAEKLKDPRWQKKRLEIMQRDEFQCQMCGDKTESLNVDHRIYRKGCSPWEYADKELQTLCETCHKWISVVRGQIAEAMLRYTNSALDEIVLKALKMFFRDSDYAVVVYEGKVFTIPGYEIERLRKARRKQPKPRSGGKTNALD